MPEVLDLSKLETLPPEQRKAAEPLLALIGQHFRQNPLLNYHPTAKQQYFHGSRDRIKAFFGGNRSGKTTAGIADDLIQAVDESALPSHLRPFKKWQPPFKCRIVSPDFTSTMEGVIFEKLREWAPKDQLVGGSWEKAYDKQRRKLSFKNGSWFDFLTSEQDIDKFSGAALHRVHFDEEPPGEKGHQIYKECRMRLIDYGGDILLTMTPLFGMSWVFDEMWEKRGDEVKNGLFKGEGITCVTVDIDENPHLNEEMKLEVLEGLTGPERKARKEGRFVHFAGLVYDEFDIETHVVGNASPDHLKGQMLMDAIDPGIKTTAILLGSFDKDNNLLVYDEITLGESSAIPEIAAQQIKDREKYWKQRPTYYIIDPAARHRSLVNAEQVSTAYMRAGILTVPGQNAVEPGVFEVKRRLERTLQGEKSGGLYISERCQRLRWEFSRYRMDPKAEGFAVIKKDDHHLDALRYLCMARPVAPHLLTPKQAEPERWIPGTAPAFKPREPEVYHPFGGETF